MFTKYGPLAAVLGVALVVVGYSSFFVVPEGKQAVVFFFERIIEPAKTEAGLHMKLPFVHKVQLFEKRIINWDGRPSEVTTREKNNIIVDTTARFRIADPILLRRTFENMSEVNSKFGKLIIGATNTVIAENDLVETVRNTNDIIERFSADKKPDVDRVVTAAEAKELATQEALEQIADAEISGDLEKIKLGREALTQNIINQSKDSLKKLGIELVDIQLKRVALEKSVELNVFTRMKTERERIVAKIKSVGSGRREEILGETKEQLQTIASTAYKEVQKIKGEADGKAVKIYADAISKDEKFYDFYRSIQAYRNGLREDSTLILSSDTEFMKLLRNGPEDFFRQ